MLVGASSLQATVVGDDGEPVNTYTPVSYRLPAVLAA